MLLIGFTNIYFTLWEFTEVLRKNYETGRIEKVSVYTYIQNLSIDKDKAIEKARLHGVTNLEPDENLKGRNDNSSFEIIHRPSQEDAMYFCFGKYNGMDICKCYDNDYINWYRKQTNSKVALEILLEREYVSEYNGEYLTPEEKESAIKYKALLDSRDTFPKSGVIEFKLTHNLTPGGVLKQEVKDFSPFPDVRFKDAKRMVYNGIPYGVPTIDGKGKRAKDKIIRAQYEIIYNEEYERTELLITSFEILK